MGMNLNEIMEFDHVVEVHSGWHRDGRPGRRVRAGAFR